MNLQESIRNDLNKITEAEEVNDDQALIARAIDQIKDDVRKGDFTQIAKLLANAKFSSSEWMQDEFLRDRDYDPDDKTIEVNKDVPLAGNYHSKLKNTTVKVSSIRITNPYASGGYMSSDRDIGYRQVDVEHDGPWEIYVDAGFEKAISQLVGFKVTGTESGMQEEGVASMEGKIIGVKKGK